LSDFKDFRTIEISFKTSSENPFARLKFLWCVYWDKL